MSLGAHSNALFQWSPSGCFAPLIIPKLSVLNCKGNYFEKRLSSENAIPYKSYGGEPSSSLHPRPTLARPPLGPTPLFP